MRRYCDWTGCNVIAAYGYPGEAHIPLGHHRCQRHTMLDADPVSQWMEFTHHEKGAKSAWFPGQPSREELSAHGWHLKHPDQLHPALQPKPTCNHSDHTYKNREGVAVMSFEYGSNNVTGYRCKECLYVKGLSWYKEDAQVCRNITILDPTLCTVCLAGEGEPHTMKNCTPPMTSDGFVVGAGQTIKWSFFSNPEKWGDSVNPDPTCSTCKGTGIQKWTGLTIHEDPCPDCSES